MPLTFGTNPIPNFATLPIYSGLARPPRAEAEKKAEARRDTLPNANATHPSAMAKDLYAATGNHEKRGSRAAVFCLFK